MVRSPTPADSNARPPVETSSLAEAAADLGERWRRARAAALGLPASPGAPEGPGLAAALAADPAGALQRVFLNSLRLGQGFTRFFRAEITLVELPDLLPRLGLPCLQGCYRHERGGAAVILERPRCAAGAELGAAVCDFHREAILGLSLGVTGEVELVRHESAGHGASRCVDVFHADPDPESPLRFGPISAAVREELSAVTSTVHAFDSHAELRFLGVSEGVLFYRLGASARPGGLHLQSIVERSVRRRLPGIELREVSPRPVLSGEDHADSASLGGP